MKDRKDYDYYIFLDYSEDLIGYNIIEQERISEILPKIKRFEHYKGRRNRKLYISHIKNTIKRENIRSFFKKIKIVDIRKSTDLFLELLEFLKKNKNHLIFISVDNYYYKRFMRMFGLLDVGKIKIIKESELNRDSVEHRLSLVIDNLLNIERRKKK